MGLIGKILRSIIEDGIRNIVTEIYTDYTKTSRHVSPAGIDSVPIEDDQGVMIVLDGTPGKTAHLGVFPDPQAEPGEVRIYSRDADGNTKAYSWYKKDGNIVMQNDNGFVNLKDDGVIELNGNADNAVAFADLKTVVQEIQNDITTLKTVFSTGWTVVAQDGGAALKAAAATWYGTPLTGNIDTAKVEEVKLP